MDECLEYFKSVISDRSSAESWPAWWNRNANLVRARFSRDDYLRLKFCKLEAARRILVDRGLLAEDELAAMTERGFLTATIVRMSLRMDTTPAI